jgi:hypothetical protein
MEKEKARLIAGERISHVFNVVSKGLCLYVEDLDQLDELFSVEILEGKIFCRFWSFVHSSSWASVMMSLVRDRSLFIPGVGTEEKRKTV